jgi:aromatic-L-amino-acid decarboxylase
MTPGQAMTPDDFRHFGHLLVDWIADYRASLDQRPVMLVLDTTKLHLPLLQ